MTLEDLDFLYRTNMISEEEYDHDLAELNELSAKMGEITLTKDELDELYSDEKISKALYDMKYETAMGPLYENTRARSLTKEELGDLYSKGRIDKEIYELNISMIERNPEE